MAQIGSLSVKLGLVTVEWDKATENAKRSAKDLQTQFNSLGEKVKSLSEKFKEFSGVGAALSFGLLYHEAVALTDELDDLSKSFGLSASEVLTFRDALEQSGGKADGASKAISTLFGKISDAKTGNDSAITQFEKLGITFDELKKLSPFEAIQKVASGLSNITDQFEKTKAIKEVFGKAGIGVDLKAVAEALKEGSGEFDKYNESIQKVGQVSDALKKNLTNLTIAFADLIAPFTQSNILSIETFSAALKGLAAGAAVAAIGTMAVNFAKLAIAMKEAAAAGALFNLTAGGATPIGLIIKAVTAAAAIGTFIYVSGSAEEPKKPGVSPRWSEMEQPVFKKPSEVLADLQKAERDNALPKFPADAAKLATLKEYGSSASKNIPVPGGLPKQEKPVSEAVSNDVKSLRAQISLTQQLINLEHQKNTFNMDVSKTELEKKLNDIEIEKQKKFKQADAEAQQKISAGGDTMSAALKSATYADADAKKKKASQEADDAKALAKQADRIRLNKDALDAEEQVRKESEQTTAEAFSFLKPMEEARKSFYDQAEEADRINKLTNDRTKYETSLFLLSDKQRQNLMDEYDLEATILDVKRQADKLGIDTTSEAFATFTQRMRETGKATLDLKNQQENAQKTFEYGWNKAFNSYVDNAQNAALRAQDLFKSMTDTINSAIDEFVEKGSISFDKLIESMIKGMIKAELQRQATSLFSSGFKALSGGNIISTIGSFFGFADGGNPPVNQPSMVGERGPELFVPKTAGTIIPNNQLAAMGGGQTINYNGPYIASMSAIDTQSGVQFLAKNKQAVWATYQSANRSIPMSR